MAQPTPEVRAERLRLRALRRDLPAGERRRATRDIARAVRRLRMIRPGTHAGVYLAVRGEADLAAVFLHARRVGAHLYSPQVISRRSRTMTFVPLEPRRRMRDNVFGIAEPALAASRGRPALRLDVVLLPLVGFDRKGNRLGMGAGFYDRALRRRRDAARPWKRPRLVGIAFACQEMPHIDPSPWDVRLDWVVTEREIVRCTGPDLPERDSP